MWGGRGLVRGREEGRARTEKENGVPDLNFDFSSEQVIALGGSEGVLKDDFEGHGLGRAVFLGQVDVPKFPTAQGTADGEIVGAPFHLGVGHREGGGGRRADGFAGSGGCGGGFLEISGETDAAAKGAGVAITAVSIVCIVVGRIVLVHGQHARRRELLRQGCSCRCAL